MPHVPRPPAPNIHPVRAWSAHRPRIGGCDLPGQVAREGDAPGRVPRLWLQHRPRAGRQEGVIQALRVHRTQPERHEQHPERPQHIMRNAAASICGIVALDHVAAVGLLPARV